MNDRSIEISNNLPHDALSGQRTVYRFESKSHDNGFTASPSAVDANPCRAPVTNIVSHYRLDALIEHGDNVTGRLIVRPRRAQCKKIEAIEEIPRETGNKRIA